MGERQALDRQVVRPATTGNIWFERIEHTWDGGKCKFCGASQTDTRPRRRLETHAYAFIHTDDIKARIAELFGDDMQFDVIIGNPPYQLNDEGFGTSAVPIYHHFVEQAKNLEPRYLSMVIPSRWFAGGKGLDEFREAMLGDDRVRSSSTTPAAADVFPGVGIKGGVCYFLWDRDNEGLCRVTTHFKDEAVLDSHSTACSTRALDVFIRFNEGLSILQKVAAVESGKHDRFDCQTTRRFDRLVSSRKPFGLRHDVQGQRRKPAGDLLGLPERRKGFIAEASPSRLALELIDNWKVFVGYAAPGTGNRDTYPTPDPQHAIPRRTREHLVGDVSVHRPVRLEERSRERPLATLRRLTRFLILSHKPSQTRTRKVVYVRADAGLDAAVDRRGALREVRHHRRRGRVHRVA